MVNRRLKEDAMTTSLSNAWQQLGRPRLAVLGDLLLDRTTWGNAERISPEAPVMVLQVDSRDARPAGAGSVCTMLRGFEAHVTPVGVVGADDAGGELCQRLQAAGAEAAKIVVQAGRSTSMCRRFIGRAAQRHAHQILCVDDHRPIPLDDVAQAQFLRNVEAAVSSCEALLISDYAQGLCTPQVFQRAIAAARRANCPVLVDPGETSDYAVLRGATLVTPNRRQAGAASGIEIRRPEDALLAGCWLCDRHDLAAVAIKLDRDGLALVTADGHEEVFSTRERAVYDVTGARDMVLATLGLCVAGGVPLEQAVPLANVAAGLKLEKFGAAAVSRQEVQAELTRHIPADKRVSAVQMARLAEEHRRQGRRVVFTNGCFDLLHVGHVTYLQQAAALGDALVVAINSDSSVRALKGPERPIYNEDVRCAMLAALDCVDHVLVFDEPTPHALLRAIRPDVLVKGGTYTAEEVVGREVVLAYGGRVCVAGKIEGVSTTSIVSGLRRREWKRRAG
jgi:D-beta-D-heptose 7-phosphate kinase/D-beta-D-heptose 1-phosphate adenosyltransferase